MTGYRKIVEVGWFRNEDDDEKVMVKIPGVRMNEAWFYDSLEDAKDHLIKYIGVQDDE